MPIIGAESIKTQIYRVSVLVCQGVVENVVISPDGLYNITYVKSGKLFNRTGKILRVEQNHQNPKNSYLLFDISEDLSAKRERIMFWQVQTIKDITPNDSYAIAVKHGFEGTVEEWLESLKGEPGKSAYELAVLAGFEGTVEEWIASLKGEKGDTGQSAYDYAVERGYEGTLEEWMAAMGDSTGLQTQIDELRESSTWHQQM